MTAHRRRRLHISTSRLGALHLLGCTIFCATFFRVNGYFFGLYDHAIHLPFVLRASDSNFLAGDPLVDSVSHHPSVLWWLIAKAVGLGISIEPLFFGVHIASLIALYWGLVALTRAVLPQPVRDGASFIAAASLTFSKLTCATIPTFDALVLNRTVVLGPQMVALAFVIEKRVFAAFALCGLCFSLHATTSAHTLFLMAAIMLVQRSGWRRWILAGVAFLITASPLLLMMMTSKGGSGIPTPAPDEWWQVARLQIWFHAFPSNWNFEFHWQYLFLALVPLCTAFASGLRGPILILSCAAGLLFLLGIVGVELLASPIVVQAHVLEVSRMVTYLAVIAMAWICMQSGWQMGLVFPLGLGLVFTFLGSDVLPMQTRLLCFFAAGSIWVLRQRPKIHALSLLQAGAFAFLFVALQWLVLPRKSIQRDFYAQTGGRLMKWAKEHLPKNAIVAIPPYMAQPLAGFRFGAQRAIVGTFKDGGEAVFSLEYAHEWSRRIKSLCACNPLDFDRQQFLGLRYRAIQLEVLTGYRQANRDRFLALGAGYGATHAVVERNHTVAWTEPDKPKSKDPVEVHQPNLPIEYQDDEFTLYRIE